MTGGKRRLVRAFVHSDGRQLRMRESVFWCGHRQRQKRIEYATAMWGQSTSGFTPTMQAWGRERGEAGGACYGPRSNRAYTGNVVVHTNSTKRQTGVIRKPVVNPFRAPIPLPITVRNFSQTTGFSASKSAKGGR